MNTSAAKRENCAARHANAFLQPIDPRHSIRRIGRMILESGETDPDIGAKLDAIQSKLGDGRPVLSDKYTAMFDRLRCAGTIPDIPTMREELRPALAAAYLRARAAVAAGGATTLSTDLPGALDKVLKLADHVESDFIGELTVETLLRAREDPAFFRTLNQGADEFRSLVNDLYRTMNDAGGHDHSSAPHAAAARAPGARGSCTCCVTRNGQRHCEPCSCWIIVIVIIIIIVAK